MGKIPVDYDKKTTKDQPKEPQVIYRGKKLKSHSTKKLIAQLRKRGLIVTVYELQNL